MTQLKRMVDEAEDVLPSVIEIAVEAGKEILKIYNSDFSVREKDDSSPITQADEAADARIINGLKQLTPSLPIVTEETVSKMDHAKRVNWLVNWLVDPLDGTKEFVEKNGNFTVNIALIAGGQPILGVVHVPVTGITYYAVKEKGAFRLEADATKKQIQVEPCDPMKVRIVASRAHSGRHLEKFKANLGSTQYSLRQIGSAVKFCLVAEGKADVYHRFGQTWEWDDAAGQCILEEAGGFVISSEGQRVMYNKRTLENPHFIAFGDESIDWLELTK